MMNFIQITFIGVFSLQLSAPVVHAAEPLLNVFRDTPPYSYVENGTQKVFLLEKTRRILDGAEIESKFQILPPKRIFKAIQDNAEPICSFG